MLKKLDLKDISTIKDILGLQIASYKVEAEIIGFYEIPNLKDTVDSLKSCEEIFYGEYLGDELAGMISYKVSETMLDIYRVAVHPKFFRMGLAQKMLSFIEGLEKNINNIVVCTGKKNTPAVSLYLKNGFKALKDIEIAEDIYLTKFEKVLHEDKKIKLIVTDLDQTFLRTDKSISSYSLDVIRKCKKQGIKIAIATARSEGASDSFAKLIEPDFVISSGGALAKHNKDVVYKCILSTELTNNLISDCLINPAVGEITVQTEKGYYWDGEELRKFPKEHSYATYNDFKKPLNQEAFKVTVEIPDREEGKKIAKKYPECSFLAFTGEKWCRFAHNNATKLHAIEKVADYLQLTLEEVAAFGDDYNDIEMLTNCGCGVAVANAIDEVMEIASYVTLSNDEDGVARFIEDNFLI